MKRVWKLPELTTKAKVGAVLIAVVIILLVATFTVTTIINKQLSERRDGYSVQDLKKEFTAKDTQARQNDALSGAQTALKSGETKKAADTYEQAIAAETDSNKKVKLAIDQSLLLLNFSKFDEAVTVAKKAESYSTDKYYISDWLGRLYENGKKYADAATYYEQAGSLSGSPTNDTGFTKKYYDSKVVEMKSRAGKS